MQWSLFEENEEQQQMKRKMWMRALALLTATAAVMTDSGMVYAGEAVQAQQEVSEENETTVVEPEIVESENTESESTGSENIEEESELPETDVVAEMNDSGEDFVESEPMTEEKTWHPTFWEVSEWEDHVDLQRPVAGEVNGVEDKPDAYTEYYGNQLEDELAVSLYESLNTDEQKETDLGSFLTETQKLEEYDQLMEEQLNAAQQAFNAFLLDETDWTIEELKNCTLQLYFAGSKNEEGQTEWSVTGKWELPEKVDEEDEEKQPSQEEEARQYRARCLEEETPCVLTISVEDEELVFQDMAPNEDGVWQIVYPKAEVEELEESEEPQESVEQVTTLEEVQMAKPVADAEITIEEKQTTEEAKPEETEENTSNDSEIAVQDAVAESAVAESTVTESAVTEPALMNAVVSGVKTQTYTGSAVMPKMTVKDISTGKKLKQGKEYTVSYENNVNAGTATAVIRGIDGSGYSGVLRVDFTIEPQNIAKKVKISVIGKKFLYTGKELTPEVSASYNRRGLTNGVDYQLSYQNNIAKGTAQIVVSGQGNYSGNKIVKFKITGPKIKDATVSLENGSGVFQGAYDYPTVKVSYAGRDCVEGTDYTVKYPTRLKAGKNTILVKGFKNFSGSMKLVYTLGQASMEKVKVSIPYAWQYTKKKVKANPSSVKLNGENLTLKKDYTIKYYAKATGRTISTIKDEGEYQILLIGKGSYTGTKTLDICVTSDQNILANNYDSGWEPEPEPEPEQPSTPPSGDPTETPAENPTVTLEDTVYKENAVPADHDRYWGYYEQYKITSKKGIQGTSAYTEDLGTQHVLLNVDMADLISTAPKDGYVPYTYKGKTYYFGDLIALKDTIYYLHGWGNKAENPYGINHMRNVTLVLLMSWKDELSYLIHPSARKKGAAPYYALNMQDENARETFEALFRYMGEWLGQYKTRVSNWTLGNEVNSCKEWNYSGSMSLNQCVENYAKAFQLLYKGVKRTATSSRVFISLDHCWTASVAGHSGKAFLDQFAAYMAQTAPDMQWNVNYHPYSDPLSRTEFWKNSSSTSDSANTKYISVRNINVLTDYLSQLESKYGKASGSIRVILGEFGYSAISGDASQEEKQAAALGYGYYIVMANTRIDSYIIRAYQDAPEEGKLKLGLRSQNDVEKKSYQVYKYMDTNQSLEYMNPYLATVGLSDWNQISGFDASAFNKNDF